MRPLDPITRRSFLTFLPAAALAPIGILDSLDSIEGAQPYHFQYDHVIGTSLDLAVWTRNPKEARLAEAAILAEIQRLASILNTRNPESEIALLGKSSVLPQSSELREVFAAYAKWERQTQGSLSLRPAGPNSPPNVDALGKAYILDRAVAAARIAAPALDGLLLNIGGDIVCWGQARQILIANPTVPHDNADPIT